MNKEIHALSYGTQYMNALTNSIKTTEDVFGQAFSDTSVFCTFTGQQIGICY